MKSRTFLVLTVLILITACNGTFEIGLEHPPVDVPSLVAASATPPVSVDTLVPSAPTETAVPTDLPASHTVQVFLIAVDDNGKSGLPIGCGDSAVAVQVEVPPTLEVLQAALVALLSIKDQFYGQSGLYNALYQSDLLVESVSIVAGKASVYLTGTLLMGGECDSPRVQAQLEQTVLQFSTVTEAAIYINGKPLADVLSLK
jgi:Sporulation and spore germination